MAVGDLLNDLELVLKARKIASQLVKDHPGILEYQLLLARGCYHTARLQRKKDPQAALQSFEQAKEFLEPLDALDVFHLEILTACYVELSGMLAEPSSPEAIVSLLRKAQTALKELLTLDPSNVKYHSGLSDTFIFLGRTYEKFGRSEDALTAYRGAIEPRRAALNLCRPDSDQWKNHRKILSEYLVALAKAQRDRRQLDESVATCLERKKLWPRDAAELYRTARLIALCVPLSDSGESGRYAAQAVAVLAEAIDSGYPDVQQMEQAPVWKPLHAREDFQKQLDRMRQNQKPKN